MIAVYNSEKHIYNCKHENYTNFSRVKIPYAFKLLMQELITMNIAPRIITKKMSMCDLLFRKYVFILVNIKYKIYRVI